MRLTYALIGMLVGLTSNTQAQSDDCDYQTNEYDPFLKKRRVITEAPWPKGALVDRMYLRALDSSYFLDISYNPGRVCSIGEGSSLMFRFANDTVLSLSCVQGDVTSISHNSGGGVAYSIYHIQPTYSMTKEQMRALAQWPVAGIRVYYTDTFEDRDVADKPKKQQNIQRAAKCLLEAIQ